MLFLKFCLWFCWNCSSCCYNFVVFGIFIVIKKSFSRKKQQKKEWKLSHCWYNYRLRRRKTKTDCILVGIFVQVRLEKLKNFQTKSDPLSIYEKKQTHVQTDMHPDSPQNIVILWYEFCFHDTRVMINKMEMIQNLYFSARIKFANTLQFNI